MEDIDESSPPDFVLAQVLKAGLADDMESVLLLCDGLKDRHRAGIKLLVPLITVPALMSALGMSAAIAHGLQAGPAGDQPVTAAPQALQATARAAALTTPSDSGSVVASQLVQGAWLHTQLPHAAALALRDALSAALARH